MKTFKSLIDATEWASIDICFQKLYPEHYKERQSEAYREVYEKLKDIAPEKTDIVLCIEFVSQELIEGEIDSWHDVYGKNQEDEYGLSLSFMPWNQWLGTEISEETLQNYNDFEIIVHCLYDMTFYGFDEKTIQDEIKRIEAKANEFENMTPEERKANTISADELFAELDKKFEKLKHNENL